MGPFVKTRSVWRGKWTFILIALISVVVRVVQIEQPFVDPWSWRQSDVAGIARNYLENDFHFSRPQIDWAGTSEGYVGTEFPILPFAAALTYQVTGVQEWVGRIQGVIFFAAALPFFFLLTRRLFGEVAALWATFFYAFAPLSIVASREFMPDVPSLSLAVAGIYFFLLWVEENDRRALVGSALLISLSFLIKLPTAVIGAPLLYLAICRNRRDEHVPPAMGLLKNLVTSWELWLFGAIAIVPCGIWYWHAHKIAETFYPYHFFGGGGFRIMNAAWYWKIARQTVLSSMTPVLFVLAAIGVFVAPRGRLTRLFHWWLAAMVLFIFFVGWGNRHQWYQLHLVPIAAAFAGCACQWLGSRLGSHRIVAALAGLVLAAAFAIFSYLCAVPFYWQAAAGLRNLGLELKEATTPAAVIIAADDGDPTVFYYAHRKGWHFLEDGIYQGNPLDSAQIIANLEKLRSRGATHIVFYAGTRWWLEYYREFAERLTASATLVEETPEFIIYRLAPASP
ncbi:MAG: glycosyltransferase family 39 protein [Verrucomicrobiota bacterium]|nr:glycosyltransferase family 39 protein [Verrucomicrobiota bacterium]